MVYRLVENSPMEIIHQKNPTHHLLKVQDFVDLMRIKHTIREVFEHVTLRKLVIGCLGDFDF